MAQNFSGALKIMDLDDFIAPAQACIVPLAGQGSSAADSGGGGGGGGAGGFKLDVGGPAMIAPTDQAEMNSAPAIQLEIEGGPKPPQGGWSQTVTDEKDAVKITLSDCLACSGCVTSAETVLMAQQSGDEFRSVLRRMASAAAGIPPAAPAEGEDPLPPPPQVCVVSISPQARASLAAKHGLSAAATHKKLVTYFKSLGVHHVVDTSFSRELGILAAQREFVASFRAAGSPLPDAKAAAGGARGGGGGGAVAIQLEGDASSAVVPDASAGEAEGALPQLPVLASACPGWVCYAEKSHPKTLPHISRIKSPQGIMGTLVKRHLAQSLGVTPAQVYHVTVMPCFDKKLEAARPELVSDGILDTDCVLTTIEVQEMIERDAAAAAAGVDLNRSPNWRPAAPVEGAEAIGGADVGQALARLPDGVLDSWYTGCTQDGTLIGNLTGDAGSGGYLESVFRYAAHELFGVTLGMDTPLEYKTMRNADFKEVELVVEGRVLLRFASAYGFRNIQTLTRKLKTPKGKAAYHYVEVMSCPSGCNNGGGQIPAAVPGKAAATALLENVATIYREGILQQPPNVAGGAPHADDAMYIENAGVSAAANSGEGPDGQDDPPQILGQLLEGGVSPVELARLAQSGRRQRLGEEVPLPGLDASEMDMELEATSCEASEALTKPIGVGWGEQALSPQAAALLSTAIGGVAGLDALHGPIAELFRTKYHHVEGTVANPLTIKW